MEKSKLKKAIIFDCDNTLWEGIIGEDIIRPNWSLRDEIMAFARRGVIIGICSKNNEQDVIPMLQRSLLLWDHFISVYRINWKDKISNLKEIAEELNIGLDSIVMVDDSDFERAAIALYLPEVLVIHPDKLTRTVLDCFDLTGDLSKTRQYKENLQRARLKEQFTDLSEYLKSLDMILSIKLNETKQVDRIAELTEKTNQFNLTTRRYTRDQIWSMMMTDENIYSLSVRDRFGDSGLVGVCICHHRTIDTFLLSCRVLGRNIEFAFLDYIIQSLKEQGYHGIIGNYIQSEKNQQVERFYSSCGFECINLRNENITFKLIFSDYKMTVPNYFKYE